MSLAQQEVIAPRRTGRERKQPVNYGAEVVPERSNGRKRKSAEPGEDGDDVDEEGRQDEDPEEDDDDDDEDVEEHLPPVKKRKTDSTKGKAPAKANSKRTTNGIPRREKRATKGKQAAALRGAHDDEAEEEEDEEEEEESFAPTLRAAAAKRNAAAKAVANGNGNGVKRIGKRKAAVSAPATRGAIKDDNALFNALLDTSADANLQATMEEWVLEFSQTGGVDDDGIGEQAEGAKVAEMVEFLFRCCGLNEVIDADVATDWDGIEGKIDDMLDAMTSAKEAGPAHPLVSREKQFKSFRTNLDAFLSHLVTNLSTTSLLYITNTSVAPTAGPTTPLIQLVLFWLTPMSLSPYRGIRHTATYIAMSLAVAISQVLRDVSKTVDEINRQIEAENRRGDKDKGSGKVAQKRKDAQADLIKTKKQEETKRAVLDQYLKETFDGIFVHRYRDADSAIRADCLKILGTLLKQYPERWVNSTYLTYLDWSLTDHENAVRQEAVRALQPIYEGSPRVSSIRSFTSRAIPRLIEMGVRDINLTIRVQAVRVLCDIQRTGLLSDGQETQQDNVACLVYDKEPRIRKAAASFVKLIWEEKQRELVELNDEEEDEHEHMQTASARRGARKSKNTAGADGAESDLSDIESGSEGAPSRRQKKRDPQEHYPGWKALSLCLMAWSRRLESAGIGEAQVSQAVGNSQKAAEAAERERDLLVTLGQISHPADSHAWTAVDALWTDIPLVQDWTSLIEILLLDQTKANVAEKPWALTEEEETFLLDMLHAIVKKSRDVKGKEVDAEVATNEMSRVLINSMTALLAKNQNDSSRLAEVLRLMSGIKFEMYKEMRLTNQYQNLWTELSTQYTSKSDPVVLRECLTVLKAMLSTTALQEDNADKLRQLKDSLASSLRDCFKEQNIATISFEDEDVAILEVALVRISNLFPYVDIRDMMDVNENDKQAGLWEIVLAVVDRGRLGYYEEVKAVQSAMQILLWYLSWTAIRSRQPEAEAPMQDLVTKRDEVFSVLTEYASGQGNVGEGVMDHAFLTLLKLHVIFRPTEGPGQALSVEMPEMIQYKLSGHVDSVIERYREVLRDSSESPQDVESEEEAEDEYDDVDAPIRKRRKLNAGGIAESKRPSTTESTTAAEFHTLIWTYVSAMRVGVIDAQHASGLLKCYGQTDEVYDNAMATVVEVLQDEGQYNEEGELVGDTIGQALRDSFQFHLDSENPADLRNEPASTMALARAVQPAFFVHKGQSKVERRLALGAQVDFHTSNIDWILKEMSKTRTQERAAKDRGTISRLKLRFHACLSFFRILSSLTPALTGRDALKVKNVLAESLKRWQFDAADRRKAWEPYPGYERRLLALASGDKQIKAASRKQATAAVVVEEEDAPGRNATPTPTATARPRPKPRLARDRAVHNSDLPMRDRSSQPELPTATGEEVESPLSDGEDEHEEDEDVDEPDEQPVNGHARPLDDDDDLELPDADAADLAALAADDDDRASLASVQSYQPIRPLKRIRRL